MTVDRSPVFMLLAFWMFLACDAEENTGMADSNGLRDTPHQSDVLDIRDDDHDSGTPDETQVVPDTLGDAWSR